MAITIKARAMITVAWERDILATYRFYKISSSTATPSAPSIAEGKTFINSGTVPSGWSKVEPAYDGESTNSLYIVDLTSFSDTDVSWSDVSKSSSYEAAKQAYNKADQLSGSVEDAIGTAGTALDQASSASNQSGALITSLEELVSLIGVDNWVTTKQECILTDDTEVEPGKFYFLLVNGEYVSISPNLGTGGLYEPELTGDDTVVSGKSYFRFESESYVLVTLSPSDNPNAMGLYEFVKSEDVNVDPDKSYYSYNSSTGYQKVNSPTDTNPSLLGLYELKDSRNSISNFISTHLVTNTDGSLSIQTDNVQSQLRLTGSGIELINENGDPISTFSEDITLGDVNKTHVVLSPGDPDNDIPPKLSFWDEGTEVAYINSRTMHLKQSIIDETLSVGQFTWKVQSSNRISLVYTPA